jgi:hypothetical protein
MRHALASKTSTLAQILGRSRQSRRWLQNRFGQLRRAAEGKALRSLRLPPLEALPDWDWREISAHLRCTVCGTVGYVDTRNDWSKVIDFNKGIG